MFKKILNIKRIYIYIYILLVLKRALKMLNSIFRTVLELSENTFSWWSTPNYMWKI